MHLIGLCRTLVLQISKVSNTFKTVLLPHFSSNCAMSCKKDQRNFLIRLAALTKKYETGEQATIFQSRLGGEISWNKDTSINISSTTYKKAPEILEFSLLDTLKIAF